MIKCYACGSDMDMKDVPGYPGQLETLCDGCHKAARDAINTNEWQFEGLFWDHDILRRGTITW